LKVGLTDPKWDKGDNGSVIEPEFVSRIIAEKTNEARTYLSIDGFTLITEGFDQGAMATVDKEISSSSASASARVDRESNVKKVEPKSSKEYSGSEIGTNFTYKVEGGFWKYKNGNAWTKVMNPSSIKKLMEKFPKSVSGGNYAIVPTKDFEEAWAKSKAAFIYQKSGGKWQYSTPGPAGWTDIADPKSKQYLDKYYGSGSSSSSSTSGSQTKTLDKIDSFEAIGAIQTKLEQAVSAAGITLSEGGIKADATGLKWEFGEYKYQLSTNGQITGKDGNDKQFISGKISADYSKVVLSSGVTVSIKEFLRRTTMNDLKKKNLSDARIAELAGKLDSSLMRMNASEETINGVYKAIKTYADLVAIHKQFDKITQTEKNLLGALNGELDTGEWNDLMGILDDNGLLGTTIDQYDGAPGYGKMLAIAKAAIDNK
jgi:hypothetical protein